jgi:hypothetical protein
MSVKYSKVIKEKRQQLQMIYVLSELSESLKRSTFGEQVSVSDTFEKVSKFKDTIKKAIKNTSGFDSYSVYHLHQITESEYEIRIRPFDDYIFVVVIMYNATDKNLLIYPYIEFVDIEWTIYDGVGVTYWSEDCFFTLQDFLKQKGKSRKILEYYHSVVNPLIVKALRQAIVNT